MKFHIDMSKVVPVSKMSGDDDEDTALLKEMSSEAQTYVKDHKWCKNILECYFGFGVGGIFAVFLFHIVPAYKDVDDYIWVIVGDIPPLYITVDYASNPARALDGYLGAMEEWVEAVMEGRSLEKIAPVNAPPTIENAESLKRRIEFIGSNFLSMYEGDLV